MIAMADDLNISIDPATMRKRRLGLLALTACGIAVLTGLGIAGRFDLSIGLDKTWAGPVRLAVNGAVGEEATADQRANADASQMARSSQAAPSLQAPTAAELEAYDAAQRELASALQETFRSTAAEMDAAMPDSEETPEYSDKERQPYRDATAAMNDVTAKLRQ
jgi:hypothetical protein